jgi:DNA-binding response OmpR family regulator
MSVPLQRIFLPKRRVFSPIGKRSIRSLKILSALIKYPQKVFTRAELIDIALGDEFTGYDRAVDIHVKNLRQKIEDDSKNPDYVLTMHGLGYKFGGN